MKRKHESLDEKLPPLNLAALDAPAAPSSECVQNEPEGLLHDIFRPVLYCLEAAAYLALYLLTGFALLYSGFATVAYASELGGWCGTVRLAIAQDTGILCPLIALCSIVLNLVCRSVYYSRFVIRLMTTICVTVSIYTLLVVFGGAGMVYRLMR